ncbi:MAG TPA: hypothetical protein VFA23_06040 [Dongiaceae bacterium]|nr:hypothetical protein [Dongiaceae bacterium]
MRPAAILLLGALALGACGVKSDPQPPKPDSFPRQYPAPEPLPKAETPPKPATDTTDQPMYQ